LRLLKTFSEKWRLFIMREAFIKITTIFEDFFREMEALITKQRLFRGFGGFLKTFSHFEAFKIISRDMEDFFIIVGHFERF
jgi:hypothetical protein